MLDLQDTIVAVGSGLAVAPRAIVRVSGPQCKTLLDTLLVANTPEQLNEKAALLSSKVARRSVLPIRVGLGGRTLEVDCYFWPNARSYTGEPSVEIHLLGSMPVVESLVEEFCRAGARPAGRGEFTLRSFLAGKVDLTQAEAVLGVIEAETDEQITRALSHLGGNISQPVRQLRDALVELTAHVEAGMDFVEEDIEFISTDALAMQLHDIESKLVSIREQLRSRGTRSRSPHVVLVGPPNAGKSTLFNALLSQSRVIVSDEAGTTRDAITETLQIDGLQLRLTDTAGVEELADGTPRALAQAALADRLAEADLVLLCNELQMRLPEELVNAIAAVDPSSLLYVGTKADLHRSQDGSPANEVAKHMRCDVAVSAHAVDSVEQLKRLLAQRLAELHKGMQTDAMHRTMVRCGERVQAAIESIGAAVQLIGDPFGEELVATELRIAIDDLSSVIGEVHTEDILGEIFSRFCIGK